ncbi:MAG: hypothetical protein JW995_01350 [Melioribacteraceae bacterium]|nr:hypothetical protein [Melioribacteraceae bacterium]
MLERHVVFDEVERQGLKRDGYNFIDAERRIVVNTAYVLSCVRKMTTVMSVENAVKTLIENESRKVKL